MNIDTASNTVFITKIGSPTIDTGVADTTRGQNIGADANSGLIQYGGTNNTNALCILGKGSTGNRLVHIFDNLRVDKKLSISGFLDLGNQTDQRTGTLNYTSVDDNTSLCIYGKGSLGSRKVRIYENLLVDNITAPNGTLNIPTTVNVSKLSFANGGGEIKGVNGNAIQFPSIIYSPVVQTENLNAASLSIKNGGGEIIGANGNAIKFPNIVYSPIIQCNSFAADTVTITNGGGEIKGVDGSIILPKMYSPIINAQNMYTNGLKINGSGGDITGANGNTVIFPNIVYSPTIKCDKIELNGFTMTSDGNTLFLNQNNNNWAVMFGPNWFMKEDIFSVAVLNAGDQNTGVYLGSAGCTKGNKGVAFGGNDGGSQRFVNAGGSGTFGDGARAQMARA
jgi:hypothetical protein